LDLLLRSDRKIHFAAKERKSMNSDCGFRIGKTHTVCQDYATAKGGETAYALLADGCSSSPDTDIGARLLVKSAEQLLSKVSIRPENDLAERLEAYHAEVIASAHAYSCLLGLDDRALDATLLTAIAQGDRWLMAVIGDGVMAMQDQEGHIHVQSVSFPGGYPCYLSYRLNEDRQRGYRGLPDTMRKRETVILKADGSIEEREKVVEAEYAPCCFWSGNDSEAVWIAVMSDGVHSFAQTEESDTSRATTPVDFTDVLRELLAFKNTNGVFVQRRLQRFEQQCLSQRWQHRDDLSLAAISLGG